MTQRVVAHSLLFMGLSFLGALIGYWTILNHTSLVASALTSAFAHAQGPAVGSHAALDPKLTNTIENDTITLYYNGSGPVPGHGEKSPAPEPITPLSEALIEDSLFRHLIAAASGSFYPDRCSKCLASAQLLHVAAISQSVPVFTNVLVRTCNALPFVKDNIRATSCEAEFRDGAGFGPYLAQLFAKMSLGTGDMQALCAFAFDTKLCDEPPPVQIDESRYFEPKPKSAEVAPEPSGHTINVLHLSDWHLDPRYDIASEGNCSTYLCCRPDSRNDELFTNARNASVPASRFGSFFCDSPADLALSALSDMPDLFDRDDLAFTIFTGDIVSHDPEDSLSQAYVAYEEETTFRVFKTMLGDAIPVYAALGNHDTLPVAFRTQHVMDPDQQNSSSNIFQWNYDLVSSLWATHGWLNDSEADEARTHYGAYAATTAQGLRIISINSDFWYKENIFNYWNVSDPDPGGILRWLADELSACERRGQRAWIIAHVLTGYDGTAPLPNPTALFYSIVRRFSPATIAAIFFGHTHQDQLQIFYDYLPSSLQSNPDPNSASLLRDTTKVDFDRPLQIAYIGPSITPLTGLNSGYRVYQVDSTTFSVVGAQTYFANISNSLSWTRPVWELEYDTRQTYSRSHEIARDVTDTSTAASPGISWPATSPLNATFWHLVTEKMLHDAKQSSTSGAMSLLDFYNRYESKSSSAAIRRGGDKISAAQKICFIRAASGALGTQCRARHGGADTRGLRERQFGLV